MTDRRWIKFWPSDWHGDKALRTCSIGARGLWMDLICIAHDGTPYGHVTINGRPATIRQISVISQISERKVEKFLAELDQAGVCSRTENGVIFSRRMVRDHEASMQGKSWISKRYAAKDEVTDPSSPPTRVPDREPSSPPTSPPTRTPSSLEERRKKLEEREEKKDLNSSLQPREEAAVRPAQAKPRAPPPTRPPVLTTSVEAVVKSVAIHLRGNARGQPFRTPCPPARTPEQQIAALMTDCRKGTTEP